MITSIIPKLPMRNIDTTLKFYTELLGFELMHAFPDYLLLKKNHSEIHFFFYPGLDIDYNYGQVYIRVKNIEELYKEYRKNIDFQPGDMLHLKPCGQKEFSVRDPDNNLLTFGQSQLD